MFDNGALLYWADSVVRPPDLVVGGLRFCRVSSSILGLLCLFVSYAPSSLTGHMLGSECNLKMRVRNFPSNRGPKNHLSSTTSELTGNFNAPYLRNET